MKLIYKKNIFEKNRPTPKKVEDEALLISRNRLMFVMITVILLFGLMIFRLFDISLSNTEDIRISKDLSHTNGFVTQRATIEDRNGTIIAINLSTASLYANPNQMIDRNIADKICNVFKEEKCSEIRQKLKSNKNFVWIKRHLTPSIQQHIHNMGIAGLHFVKDEKRIYPHDNLFSHVLGYVDVDGNGLAGIEKQFDNQLKNSNAPFSLSLDVRVQQVLHEELSQQIQDHSALGGAGLVMDVDTGEILGMVSLPDFNPNNVALAKDTQRFNQITLGTYEMGSSFKILTLVMGLDGKYIKLNEKFDTDQVIKIGNKQIKNYRNKGGIMSTPEIMMYSSNIGFAQIGIRVGVNRQREYLSDFGLLSKVEVELPEKAKPLYPHKKNWTNASLVTISYGHGIAVTPLHVARAISAVVNGGYLLTPTLIKVNGDKELSKKQLISSKTSDMVKRILRLVVKEGYGKKADVEGYFVGGKTGTAEKVLGKSYSKNKNIASFIGTFPGYAPKYLVLVLIDEAKPNKINGGFTTGGMVAAPVAGRVIEKIAPILGVKPKDVTDKEVVDKLSLEYTPQLTTIKKTSKL